MVYIFMLLVFCRFEVVILREGLCVMIILVVIGIVDIRVIS